jgi:hypothetical protein
MAGFFVASRVYARDTKVPCTRLCAAVSPETMQVIGGRDTQQNNGAKTSHSQFFESAPSLAKIPL